MATDQTFVIVGASLAGAKAAETLRAEGFDGRVVLIGEETERPYERPMLSKEYLRGEKPAAKLYVHDEGFYADNDIELMTGTRVQSLDPGAHEITLAGGALMPYSRLLLSTGAAPRRLPLPGADLPGVAYLRAMGESDALRAAITAASRVVVIGAGWIGSEVAASARQLGAEVAIVAPEAVPLERVLGPEVGGVYRDLHAGHGVDLHLSTQIEAIVGNGAAGGVRTTDGVVIEGDLVVVGVGVTPRVELAKLAGLTVENGIVVDEFLATSAPDVFAAGDVAATWNTRYNKRIRMEHWANALNQGPVAARNMLGQHTAYEKLPTYSTEQAGHPLYSETWRAMRGFADLVAHRWRDPDAGIWEIRDDAAHHVHSKLMGWLALDRALRIGQTHRLSARKRRRWQRARDALAAEVKMRGFDPAVGSYTRSYGSTDLDAALLILPLLGIEDPGSPRVDDTINAVRDGLSAGGPLLYRYPPGRDGLPGTEGAFLPCSFWLVQALAHTGRRPEAVELFEALLDKANPLGLYGEEMDPATGAHLGNFPAGPHPRRARPGCTRAPRHVSGP